MNHDEIKTWLEGVKPGDVVAECYPGIGAVPHRTTVERRTPSGRLVVGGRQYDGVDGRERGGRHYIRPWREEDDREALHRSLTARLMDVQWRDLPTKTLERVAAALDQE